jgi:hypothetical protein
MNHVNDSAINRHRLGDFIEHKYMISVYQYISISVYQYISISVYQYISHTCWMYKYKRSNYGGCVHTDVTSCSASRGEGSDYNFVPTPNGALPDKETSHTRVSVVLAS